MKILESLRNGRTTLDRCYALCKMEPRVLFEWCTASPYHTSLTQSDESLARVNISLVRVVFCSDNQSTYHTRI